MAVGDLWECVKPNGAEEFLLSLQPIIHASKVFLEGTGREHRSIISLIYGDGYVRYLNVLEKSDEDGRLQLVSFVPIVYKSGTLQNLIIKKITESEDGTEAVIEAEFPNRSRNLFFFDPLFFYDKEYLSVGQEYTFSLSMFVHDANPTNNLEIDVTHGPMIEVERERGRELDPDIDPESITSVKISLDGMSALLNSDESDMYEIRTKLTNIDYHKFGDIEYFTSDCSFNNIDDESFALKLFGFLNERNPAFPEIGDNLQTTGFLQGHYFVP